jgi:aspartyl-tRNA(Asn)/glutamyl-tRNA(Gln) amidotransferase subunit C
VRAVAKLARLSPSEDRVQQLRGELSAVLSYMDRLREVDVSGVEPMTHPTEVGNRLDADVPSGNMLSAETLMAMAPETMPPFVKVPKVMGEGAA